MPARRIGIGQKAQPAKAARAKELRKAMRPEERMLWNALRANRLSGLHFRRQQLIDGYIVDFYCHAAGLVVEVDGEVHDEQYAYDVERDGVLAGRDLQVMRFQNHEVRHHLPMVLHQITEACRRRLSR